MTKQHEKLKSKLHWESIVLTGYPSRETKKMGSKVYPPKHILHKKLGLLLKHMVKGKNWSQCHSVAMSLTRLQYTLIIKAMALPHFASVQCSLKHIFPIWFLDTYLDQKSYQNHKTLMKILEALLNYSRSKSLCCACMNFGAENFPSWMPP
jgi:hypothetical protein